jgi:uncharacterized protein
MTSAAATHRWRGVVGLALALLALLTLLSPGVASAQIAVPPLTGHVTDQTATLTPEQQSALEQTLSAFEARKGSQVAVLMVATTAPEAIEPYALRVAEQWKLGRKKVDDGVVVLVAKDDRAVRIEMGYGLEGALSDITSKRIISETMLPRFKQGDFYGGLQAGTEQIMRVVDGEALPAPAAPQRNAAQADDGLRQFAPMLLVVALGVGGVLRRVLGNVGGSVVTSLVVSGLAWLVIGTLFYALLAGIASLFVTLIGAGTVLRGAGGFGGGGRGGFGGGGLGGLGGGGFRGGGGGFGGGGASGRW